MTTPLKGRFVLFSQDLLICYFRLGDCPTGLGILPRRDRAPSPAGVKNSGKATYTNYSSTPINLKKGAGQGISLTATYSFYTYDEFVKIWIDYNQNGVYEEPFELAFSGRITAPALGSNVSKNVTGLINIPSTAALGITSMRVSMKRGSYPAPCETVPFGEVEDYAVNIQPAAIILPSQSGASTDDFVLYFSAQENFGTVALDWLAQAEVQSIDILRSQDGLVFETIAQLKKNAERVESMQFVDENPYQGLNFYQIRAKNKVDTEFLTDLRKVKIQGEKPTALLYPNPTRISTRLHLDKTMDKSAQVQIYTFLGKLVKTVDVAPNNQTIDLNTSGFPVGLYTVQITVQGERPILLKLIIQE